MRFLVVDDEGPALRHMKSLLERVEPDAEVILTNDSREALKHVGEPFSVLFLDIEMPGIDGIALAKAFLEVNPKQNIVFVTAYSQYALEAFKLHASGYVTKPCTAEAIQSQLLNLRYSTERPTNLRVRCFGHFEVFYGAEPILFERRTAKEIFAYLVSIRGATATREEICSILWENAEEVDRRKGYFRNLMRSLRTTLERFGMEEVLICNRNQYSVNTTMLDCDYYRYLDGGKNSGVEFRGLYMLQYSWGEETIGMLMNQEF